MTTTYAIVFPGQGSQMIGMLRELAAEYITVKNTFTEASAVLGYDLWQLTQDGPVEDLNKTWHTQPALLTASVAVWRIWQQKHPQKPIMMAGHSLGEYSALVCAGSLNFTTAIQLVALRGKLMQEAIPVEHSAMSAIIGLDNNIITAACQQAAQGQIVSPVNFNAPGQVVIAGQKPAVERAIMACKKAGAKYIISLPVSVPSHCQLMKPVAEKLALALNSITFTMPHIPVVNNVDVRTEHEPTAIRQALVRQLYSPVRWTETIELFASCGVKVLLEIGPGKVLTNLTKRIVNTLLGFSVNNPTSLTIASKQLLEVK